MIAATQLPSGAVTRPAIRHSSCRLAARARPLRIGVQAKASRFAVHVPTSSDGGNGLTRAKETEGNTQQGSTPAAVVTVQDTPAQLAPPDILAKAVELGEAKANLPPLKCFALSIMGGIFIAFGGALAVTVGPNCPELAASNPGLVRILTGLVGLPFGLLLVLVCGAELFTGNLALVAAARFNGRATTEQLVRNWGISYIGNMIGTLAVIGLMAGGSVFPEQAAGVLNTAGPKVGLSFQQAFCRAILANWFVCLATWMAIGADSLVSKIAGIYLTISSFVAIGLEHSIANMFIIPLAISIGADITPSTYLWKNLLPVTLGNMVGGAIGVAAFYSFVFGKLGRKEWQTAS